MMSFTPMLSGALRECSAVVCRTFFFFVLVNAMLLCNGVRAQQSGDVQTVVADIESAKAQFVQTMNDLEAYIEDASGSNRSKLEYLAQQKKLIEQYALDDQKLERLQAAEKQALALIEQGERDEAREALLAISKAYREALTNAEVIGETIRAEEKADNQKYGAEMYFKMRAKIPIPQKALNAFGLMEFARQERNQGRFEKSLQLYEQAGAMVQQAINEHIEVLRQWRENAEKQATERKKRIAKDVEKILADHFVKIPAGELLMGSEDGALDEQPLHTVSVREFFMGKTEVTFELYDLCVETTACLAVPDDEGWGRDQRPVINVSHQDIHKRFLPWLEALTGRKFRLPSESEWEYAARAGSQAAYSWGDNITCAHARFEVGAASACGEDGMAIKGSVPVASYDPNAFGLYDMHGNAWEWVQDCWNASYTHAPSDGSAWLEGSCKARVLRGGSWAHPKNGLRSANRYFAPYNARKPEYGFRLVMDTDN